MPLGGPRSFRYDGVLRLSRYWHFLGLQVTVCDVFEVPFALVTVSITVKVPRVRYLWSIGDPFPAGVPSPKFQADVTLAVVVLKVHVFTVHDFVNAATGAGPPPVGGGGSGRTPAPINPMYNNLLGVPGPRPVRTLGVGWPVSAFTTSAGVAVGLAAR